MMDTRHRAEPPIAPRRRRLRFHTIKQVHKTPFWSRVAKCHLNYISKNKCTVTKTIKHETSVRVVMEGGGTGDATMGHPTLDLSTNTSSYTRRSTAVRLFIALLPPFPQGLSGGMLRSSVCAPHSFSLAPPAPPPIPVHPLASFLCRVRSIPI